MPFSDLFKTTKAKKSTNKKNKGKDGTDNTVAADDDTSNKTETELQVCVYNNYYNNDANNQLTRELISARKTSHKHHNKDPSRLR